MEGTYYNSATGKQYSLDQPGTLNTPDVVPDYGALIRSDPGYMAYLSNRDLTVAGAGSQRRAAARALALNYGGLPAGFKDPYGDFDPATLAQAAANPQSQQARMRAGFASQQQQLMTGLAARGALHSGDLVQGQQTLDTGLQGNLYDAGQAFGGAFQGAVGDYTGAVSGAYAGEPAAIAAAQAAQAALHPVQAGAAATLDPDWMTSYGEPVYKGPDGSLFSIDPGTGSLVPYGDTQVPAAPSTPLPTPTAAPDQPTGYGGVPYVPRTGPFVAY